MGVLAVRDPLNGGRDLRGPPAGHRECLVEELADGGLVRPHDRGDMPLPHLRRRQPSLEGVPSVRSRHSAYNTSLTTGTQGTTVDSEKPRARA